jgi:hypothetical protein
LGKPCAGNLHARFEEGGGGGLSRPSATRLIRVSYPDADRSLLCQTQITVYLFFDGNNRLLKHWVDEFYLMP